MNFTCPVCAFALNEPPADYAICPCCGTEFGLDDFESSHKELRFNWVARGAQWFSPYTVPPQGWNPLLQLLRAGFAHDVMAPNSSFGQERREEVLVA